jgi:serine protease Do
MSGMVQARMTYRASFKPRGSFAAVVGFVLTVPLALVYWPSACAPQSVHRTAQSVPQASAPAVLVSPVTVGASKWEGLLPHPAFAMAQAGDASGGSASIADIAERVTSSVVNISSERMVKQQQMPFPFFFGPQDGGQGGPERKQQGSGSGVIVGADGIVLTNNHVVEEATEIKVTTSDKREFVAEVVGTDAKSDLAVLRLKGPIEGLKPLAMGDSSRMRLGDVVLAIGNPFGVGQTVTMGIVSATGRADVGIVDYEDFIQTDAAINPGNSGGALVNMRGELIGINTAILSRSGGYQGIGFSIPTKMAQPIMESLISKGRVSRGFLGVGIQDLNAELASALGVAVGTRGILISDVRPDGAAAAAGIKQGDIVVKVDGTPVESAGRFRNLIGAKGGNAIAVLDILRAGKPVAVQVKLAELEEAPVAHKKSDAKDPSTLGLELAPLTDAIRKRLELDDKEPGSVIVAGVGRGSPSEEAGIRPGDVLLEINRQPVKDLASAQRLLKGGDKVVVLVRRGGGSRYVVLVR